MIREVFLQQNAFSDTDAFSSLEKTGGILEALVKFYDECRAALEGGVLLNRLLELPIREEVARLRDIGSDDNFTEKKNAVLARIKEVVGGLAQS
jgi:V/A-type H+-transporting ATPase subunit A